MPHYISNLLYLASAVLFIMGLKGLTHPRTAVRGNLLGALGMLLAIVTVLLDTSNIAWWGILLGVVIGGGIGAVLAIKIQMTGMPQMVALFNGFGGAASVFVAGAALAVVPEGSPTQFYVSIALSGLIGAVTLFGSFVAFGKLQGLISGQAILLPARQLINVALALLVLFLAYRMISNPADATCWYWPLAVVACVLGVLVVIPIGGADMPVVIALLNSYSGMAAAATGFVLNNNVLIVSGSLVGASGVILTRIMCKAMNRSLVNVIFGVLGPTEESASADDVYAGRIKSTSAEEVAMLFDSAQRAVIVPGYGLAVSQAQHAVRDLMNLLEANGCEVEFAIHPVAGRMPGHMNVLLAEADVPYDKLKEMDVINPTLEQADIVLVIGANDVVNPEARTNPASPIAGMPIIDVDKARTVIVVKRSLSPGFAGIPNPLFALDNTLMYFGDAKKAMNDLIAAIKEG